MQYPSQQYVESFLEPLYAPISQAFYGAFQQMRRGTIDSWPTFRPRSRASVFHDYLTQNLKALLAGHLNVRYAEQRGMAL